MRLLHVPTAVLQQEMCRGKLSRHWQQRHGAPQVLQCRCKPGLTNEQFCTSLPKAGMQADLAASKLAPCQTSSVSQGNPALTHAVCAAAETPLGRRGSASAQSWQPTTMTSCCPRWSRTAPSECMAAIREELLLLIWDAVPGSGKGLSCCSNAKLRLRFCLEGPAPSNLCAITASALVHCSNPHTIHLRAEDCSSCHFLL